MSYREPPPREPLVLILKNLLIAVEPESGVEIWRHMLRAPASRMFLVESRLFVATGDLLACFDSTTGKEIGAVSLGFIVRAGFVRGQRLFLTGRGGAAVVTLEGNVLWKCDPENIRHLISDGNDDDMHLFAKSASGDALWDAKLGGSGFSSRNSGLLLGNSVAQPDLD